MIHYTENTLKVANNFNISPKDVLFCYLLASGASKAEAYQLFYLRSNQQLTIEAAEQRCNDFLSSNPGMKVLIVRLKNNKNKLARVKEEENKEGREREEGKGDEFCTRDGLVKNLIYTVNSCQGKDRANILMTLAKLQGLDKPEEGENEEKTVFYLPYVSKCNSCELMKLYKKVKNDSKSDDL